MLRHLQSLVCKLEAPAQGLLKQVEQAEGLRGFAFRAIQGQDVSG